VVLRHQKAISILIAGPTFVTNALMPLTSYSRSTEIRIDKGSTDSQIFD
jgi:hypothetical protein